MLILVRVEERYFAGIALELLVGFALFTGTVLIGITTWAFIITRINTAPRIMRFRWLRSLTLRERRYLSEFDSILRSKPKRSDQLNPWSEYWSRRLKAEHRIMKDAWKRAEARKNPPVQMVFAKRPESGELFRAVHKAARENTELNANYTWSEAENIAQAGSNIEVPFGTHAEGVSWTLANWGLGDFDRLADVIQRLGDEELAETIRRARQLDFDSEDAPEDDLPFDHPEVRAWDAKVRQLEDDFERIRGVERYQALVNAYLDQNYPWASG